MDSSQRRRIHPLQSSSGESYSAPETPRGNIPPMAAGPAAAPAKKARGWEQRRGGSTDPLVTSAEPPSRRGRDSSPRPPALTPGSASHLLRGGTRLPGG